MDSPDSIADDVAIALYDLVRSAVPRTPPLSTYRLQLGPRFGFGQARAVVPYLARLGITDVYLSPVLKAVPGSSHGYDVVDYQSLNPELGSEAEFDLLCADIARAGMGLLLDFVPNHMGIDGLNRFWEDVLECGPASLYADFFDIDWAPVKDELRNKVLVPVLGDQYGWVLDRGELSLSFENGAFFVTYFEHRFPLAPWEYRTVLTTNLQPLLEELGADHPGLTELQSIVTEVEHLSPPRSAEKSLREVLHREKQVVKKRLAALCLESPRIERWIEQNLVELNGRPGDARSFDRLDAILSGCCYRLAHWRVAGEEINYRRFFDINSLIAIRQENPDVFAHTHRRLFEWISQGKVSGLRIDHPDGLFDPTAYFVELQEAYFVALARKQFQGPESDWPEVEKRLKIRFRQEAFSEPDRLNNPPLYVVVEKIQGGRERIPSAWAVHGTTGYRFANSVSGILVDRRNQAEMTEVYHRFIGGPLDFERLLYEKKKLIMDVSMASEMNLLAQELNRISEMNRRTRDFTWRSLRRALVEFMAHFPVYRTYIDDWRPEIDARDRQYIEWTISRATQRDPTTVAPVFEFLKGILLRQYPEHLGPDERRRMLRFAMKLQQLTGPVTAKAMEDTVFYIYNRLVSLNEVGGEPERFGITVETFHLRNQERAQAWPHALLTTSTHDTKRSEDVRARLNVISEIPQEWEKAVLLWRELNRQHQKTMDRAPIPDPNDEYLFYQTVLAAYPMGRPGSEELLAFAQRMADYMIKAVREAKVHGSWLNPDSVYEDGILYFVRAVLDPARSAVFLNRLAYFKERVERAGQINALVQVFLKLASPGTADTYQGTELWDLSLVDPDNRRPVDFELRRRMLEELSVQSRAADGDLDKLGLNGIAPSLAVCRAVMADLQSGRAKMFVLHQMLHFRKRWPHLFKEADYRPIDVIGPQKVHAVSWMRQHGGEYLLAVAPRLIFSFLDEGEDLASGFRKTLLRLPQGSPLEWTEYFTRQKHRPRPFEGQPTLDLSELFADFPVALLYATAS